MIKRLICFICALCLLSLPCVCAEEYKTDYTKEIEFLTKLGVKTDKINAETKITRGQTAIAFAQALNIENSEEDTKQIYLDVNSGDSAYKAVYALRKRGILSDSDSRLFNPDNEITYNEVIKMAASALGYEKFAQANGGYPGGYIKAAADAGILKKIDGDGVITKAEVYALLYNVLFADIMEVSEIKTGKDGKPQIKFQKGKTALTDYRGLTKKSGQLTATYYASIYGKNTSSEDSIVIDGKTYKSLADVSISDIGAYTEYYVDDDDVVYAVIRKNSTIYTFDSDDIDNKTTPSMIYYYTESGKEKRFAVSPGAYYMLNAKPIVNPTNVQMIPAYGKLELTDIDEDDVIDVVKIWNYKSYYITSMAGDNFFVSENDDGITYVKYKDLDKTVTVFDKNMNEINESRIQTGKVVTLAENADTLIIFVSDETFSGVMEAESDDGRILIDGLSYKYLPSCKLKDSYGKKLKYYMDVNETVVYADTEEETDYAMLYAVGRQNGAGGNSIEVKLYDKGYFDIYETESKIRFSEDGGTTFKTIPCGELYDKFYDSAKDGIRRQLIKYGLRDNKLRTVIKAREEAAANEDEFRLNMNYGEDVEWNMGTRQVMYKSDDSSINYMWSNSGTYVYIMNDNEKDCSYASMDSMFGGHYAVYGDVAQYYTNVKGYELTEMGYLKYIVIETDKVVEKKTTYSSPLAMVTGNKKILDSDGSEVDSVEAYTNENGTRAVPIKENLIPLDADLKNTVRDHHTRYAAGTVAFGDLKKGDIIQFVKDTFSGRVTAFTLLSRGDDMAADYSNNKFNSNRWDSVITGTVEEKSAFGIKIRGNAIEHAVYGNSIPIMMEAERDTAESFDKVYRYISDKEKFELVTPNDLYEGARVWCYVEDKYYQYGVILVIIE